MSDDAPDPPAEKSEAQPALKFAEFLETTPPNTLVTVAELRRRYRVGFFFLNTPDIRLHCNSESCGRTQFFAYTGEELDLSPPGTLAFLPYECRNCQQTIKTFALSLTTQDGDLGGTATKYGENPPFGPHTPGRLITLVGPDRDAFLKGRRAENLGLGIGAFAYYRRVVENQKDRLLSEIIRVAERTGAAPEMVTTLQAAKRETQFSKAVEAVKDAIPETLKIQGHNPLTLLHSALSEGLHAQTDEECLAAAGDVRVVLQVVAERAAAALKDDAELKSALTRLLNRK